MNANCKWDERRQPWRLSPSDARTEYEVDFARVIHSGSFRRLQGKTQILNLGDSDFYRTRLTHSLEVSNIASGIVRYLYKHASYHPAHANLPPTSLIQAVSLTHDLGHPPFGHGGEVALNYCMRDHGGFEGNGQTLRIATKLEHFSDNHGYNFTRRVILGILKYPVPYKSVVNPDITPSMKPGASAIDIIDRKKSKPPKCYFDCEQEVVDWVLSSVSFEDRTLFQNTLIVEGKHKRTLHKSLDASIMDTADDIAYGIHDLEDSIALRLISEKEFRLRIDDKICSPLLEFLASKGESVDTYNNMVKSLFGSGKERKRCISRLVGVMINSTRFTTCEVLKDPIVRYGVGLSEEHRAFLDRLQEIVEEFVILSPNVQHLEFKGQTMVVSVFEALASDPKSLLPRDAYESFVKSSEPNRVICDFVAGMTDRYLLKTFERLFSPRMGSVFDKL